MGWWIGSDKLSTEQREIIVAIKKNLTQVHWVQGAAGVGKTTVLADLAQELYVESQELYAEYPNASFYYLTYTHALKELARKSFVEEGVERIKIKFLTHTQFLKNNRVCDFVFLDEVQDISTNDLLKIKKLAKHLIIAGDCDQTIYDNSPSEQEIINTLVPTQYVLKAMYRLTESLAAIAIKILPSSNIESAKPSNTLANTEARLMRCPDQRDEFIWVVTEALARARADKPSCIIFSHHQDITAFYHTIAEYFKIEYSGSELYEKNLYDNSPLTNPHLNYLTVNQNFKSHQVNLCYLGNGYGTLNEADKKPMVYIMTYHSAKGLDFDNIFIPQLNSNKDIVHPFVLAKNPNLDKRLLYVAVTRSRCNLFLTYSTTSPHFLVQNLPNTKVITFQPNQDNNDEEDFF